MSVLAGALGIQKARKKNDFYPTIDRRAIAPLLAAMTAVGDGRCYAEPCAGKGDLIHLLEGSGLACEWGLELEPPPMAPNFWPIGRGNALQLVEADCDNVDCFITNPPWTRAVLHPLIAHLATLRPCWMLFDASWKHTRQATRLGEACTDIVSVGRLKWFAGSAHDPPTDCAWYRFDLRAERQRGPTRFHWPVARCDGEAQALLL